MKMDNAMLLATGFLVGCACGVLGLWLLQQFLLKSYRKLAEEMLSQAEQQAVKLKAEASLEIKEMRLEAQRRIETQKQEEFRKLESQEDKLRLREEKLEQRMEVISEKLSILAKKETLLETRQKELSQKEEALTSQSQALKQQLETLASLSSSEGKTQLLKQLNQELEQEKAGLIRKHLTEVEEEAEEKAQQILSTAIGRLAIRCSSNFTVTTVHLPSDEMKGRVIGREGRNIRTLERVTGVNFLIDDTPNAIVLSGLDPIRLQVAKTALQQLIEDGRIHPTQIEETVKDAQEKVQKMIRKEGEAAALRVGITNLHPELSALLGKLKFRHSLGQNVLDHSLEVAHLMGLMAAELKLNVPLAKRIGLLHDIGKAVSHEMEGTHALIGQTLARKYGESDEVANGIGCHHNEIDPITIEGSLCGAADAISASRPGARVEAVEEYIRRVKRLEEIAYEFPGVEQAYALQAGRELRISVLPEMIDDNGAINLARDLCRRIEAELTYPGKIKVTLIREKRAVEYAV